MADTLNIFGTEYTNVTGIIASDDNGNELTYTRGGGTPTLQTKSVSYTPTETAQSETVTADSGYDGLDEVSVSVGAISSTYVGSGITQRSSSDLTASGATVTVPSGYYSAQASKVVSSGTEGTPTATKGTVSNHSISVTPSVTNTAGYINGGTKTGTAVSVSASELVSGTLTISSSGTKDVTNYASASVSAGTAGTPTATKGTVSNHSVSVTPSVTNTSGYITGSTINGTAVTVSASELVSGSQTLTDNGTTDVTNLASVTVSIPFVTYYTGSSTPSSSTGSNGDIYLKVVSSYDATFEWDYDAWTGSISGSYSDVLTIINGGGTPQIHGIIYNYGDSDYEGDAYSIGYNSEGDQIEWQLGDSWFVWSSSTFSCID